MPLISSHNNWAEYRTQANFERVLALFCRGRQLTSPICTFVGRVAIEWGWRARWRMSKQEASEKETERTHTNSRPELTPCRRRPFVRWLASLESRDRHCVAPQARASLDRSPSVLSPQFLIILLAGDGEMLAWWRSERTTNERARWDCNHERARGQLARRRPDQNLLSSRVACGPPSPDNVAAVRCLPQSALASPFLRSHSQTHAIDCSSNTK